MVVFKVDINRVFTRPAESDAVVSGDGDRPSLGFAVQTVEPVLCHVQVLQLRCRLQRLKDADTLPDIFVGPYDV